MHAVVGLRTMLGVGDEGLVFLTNLVGLGTTQIELEGCLSSPQCLRDCVAKKGLISLCWVCVGVLEVRLVLV